MQDSSNGVDIMTTMAATIVGRLSHPLISNGTCIWTSAALDRFRPNPAGLRQIVVGYEYNTKMAEIHTRLGAVISRDRPTTSIRFQRYHEHVHIAKLDVTHTIFEWRLEDSARVEIMKMPPCSRSANLCAGGPETDLQTRERTSHVQE